MKEIKTEEQKRAFDLGVTYLKAYLIFCGGHPKNEDTANYDFAKGIFYFALGNKAIPNSKGLSFEQFCKEYSVEDLKSQHLA